MSVTKAPTHLAIVAAMKVLGQASGFGKGDTVKVVRTFTSKNQALCCNLDADSDDKLLVGKTFEITFCDPDGSFELDNDTYFPWYCLELVHKAASVELNNEYDAEISKDGKTVEVGCQTIKSEKVLELADRIREIQKAQPVVVKKPAKKAVKKSPARRAPFM